MKINEIYRVADDVRVREEEFGLLLVSKITPALALNNDMKIVWELIDGKRTCGQIVSEVKSQFVGENIEEKIAEAIDSLAKVGLIQAVKEL